MNITVSKFDIQFPTREYQHIKVGKFLSDTNNVQYQIVEVGMTTATLRKLDDKERVPNERVKGKVSFSHPSESP